MRALRPFVLALGILVPVILGLVLVLFNTRDASKDESSTSLADPAIQRPSITFPEPPISEPPQTDDPSRTTSSGRATQTDPPPAPRSEVVPRERLVTLHVFAGGELSEAVELRTVRNPDSPNFSGSTLLHLAGELPLQIEAADRTRSVWVSADGYARQLVSIPAGPGSYDVILKEAGHLRILTSFAGAPFATGRVAIWRVAEPVSALLRQELESAGPPTNEEESRTGSPITPASLEKMAYEYGELIHVEPIQRPGATFELDWITPGVYLLGIAAEEGPGRFDQLEVVIIESRGSDVVSLSYGPPGSMTVHLAGQIRVPAEWEACIGKRLSSLILQFDEESGRGPRHGRSQMLALTASSRPVDDLIIFNFGPLELVSGKYSFQTDKPSVRWDVDVDTSNSNLVLDASAPGLVSVTVHLPETGNSVEEGTIEWWVPNASGGGSPKTVEIGSSSLGSFDFCAPKGEIVVAGYGKRWELPRTRISVSEGRNEIDLECLAHFGFRLVLSNADNTHFRVGKGLRVSSVDGGGAVLAALQGRRGVDVTVSKPGIYRVMFPHIPGFEAIEEMDVFVQEPGHRAIEVRLTPKRK